MRTGDEATKSLHYQVCVGHKSQPYDRAPDYQVGDRVEDSRVQTYALSFYRSQNVLCRSKCFEPVQKFDCI